MRKNTLRIVLGLLIGLILLGFIPTASAQQGPPPGCPPVPTPGPPPYPPRRSTLNVSATAVNPGDPITVSGSLFQPNSQVTVVLVPQGQGTETTLGTFTTDADGNFTGTVTIPTTTAPGNFQLEARGQGRCPPQRAQVLAAGIRVLGAQAQRGGAGAATARTGADVLPWILLAGAVIVVGGGLLFITRRRSARSVSE